MLDSRPPDLPEEFGNPWMSNLQEIEPPESITFVPETIGWYVLAGLLVLGSLWLGWRAWKRWSAGAYRREALRELSELVALTEDAVTRAGALRRLPVLLKRVALVAYPRIEVARLSGDAWLGFLDQAVGSTEFTRGVGRLLPALAYDVASVGRITEAEANDLFSLAGRWIRRHRSPRRSGKVENRDGGRPPRPDERGLSPKGRRLFPTALRRGESG